MQRPLNRLSPRLPPQAMKTYSIATPLRTHFEFASCAQVQCGAYVHGWRTTVDETTARGQAQAHHIRRVSRRG